MAIIRTRGEHVNFKRPNLELILPAIVRLCATLEVALAITSAGQLDFRARHRFARGIANHSAQSDLAEDRNGELIGRFFWIELHSLNFVRSARPRRRLEADHVLLPGRNPIEDGMAAVVRYNVPRVGA